jgi:hypothetical protein
MICDAATVITLPSLTGRADFEKIRIWGGEKPIPPYGLTAPAGPASGGNCGARTKTRYRLFLRSFERRGGFNSASAEARFRAIPRDASRSPSRCGS